jgi:phage FluMu protein Com
MIDTNEVKIRCPKCNKLVCSMENNANPEGIHFWCSRCKTRFDIIKEKNIENRALAANSL